MQAPTQKCSMRATDTTLRSRIANVKNNHSRRKKRKRIKRKKEKNNRESNDINKIINKIHFVKVDFFIIYTLRSWLNVQLAIVLRTLRREYFRRVLLPHFQIGVFFPFSKASHQTQNLFIFSIEHE